MESDNNLLNNFVPMLATIFGATVACTIIFQRLKRRWPVKANCWFCNKNSKIPRKELEWWFCSFCQQYNGFSQNGGYAYDIPEQYVPSNGLKIMSSSNKKLIDKRFRNGLCNKCNKYEMLKLSKLSAFEPTCDRMYDYEVKSFKDRLEAEYPLCPSCKTKVQSVLCDQALWLSRHLMLFFTQKSIGKLFQKNKKVERTCHTILIIIASGTAYYTKCWLLPICGAFFQLLAYSVSPNKRLFSNLFIMILWTCLIALLPMQEEFWDAHLNTDWFKRSPLQYITRSQIIVTLISIICLMNIKFWVVRNGSNNPIVLKKLNKSREKNMFNESEENKKKFEDDYMMRYPPPVNFANTSTAPLLKKIEANESLSSSRNSVGARNELLASSWKSIPSENLSINNISNNLNSLFLSDYNLPRLTSRTPEMFEKRIYNATSPDIFTRMTNGVRKRHVLAPPKLKSVTQTSWVAGGYWQEGMDAPTLSRSSSQSSGFDSAGSNFNPSKEPSVYEFDRCSLASEVNSVKSFDRQCPSQCTFVKPQYLPRGQICRLSPSHPNSQQHTLISHNCLNTNKFVNRNQCAHYHSSINDLTNLPEKQVIPSNTVPVITSHTWLSALLCGSLVINIIVLCVTLSR